MTNGTLYSADHTVDEDGPTTPFFRADRDPTRPPASSTTPHASRRPTSQPAAQPPPRSSRECLWDSRDVAAFLKVSRSWVYHQAEGGTLPCVRVGGLLRFHAQKIKDLAVTDALSANIITRGHEAAPRRQR
jgi:Helix-turn-helix domain